jgi:hypothetical protein
MQTAFEISRGIDEDIIIPTEMTSPYPIFYGYCYYCDYTKHSQNFCPLRFCYSCHNYGHSSKVCHETSVNDWRWKPKQQIEASENHCSFYYVKKRNSNQLFGATWKQNKLLI